MNSGVTCVAVAWLLTASAGAPLAASRDLRLIDAMRKQDIAAVRLLITENVDVNTPQGDGATPLHWAAYWDDVSAADLLIRAGAAINVANDLKITPLWIAATAGSAAMVERLLAGGGDANTANATHVTALMAASRTGSASAVAALLARGARVNDAESSRGQTALMWASAQGHSAIVTTLLDHGADVRARSRVRPALVNRGDYNGGRANRLEDVGRGGFTALMFAARNGDVDVAESLVAAGADVNDAAPDGTAPLLMAAHSGHGPLAALLLRHGADPNAAAAGYTALHAAILRGDVELVKTLLERRADPRAFVTKGNPLRRFGEQQFVLPGTFVGSTPFLLAARYAEVELMKILAAGGADTAVAMPDGTTALMLAAGVGWSDVGVGGFADRHARFLPAGASPIGVPDWTRTLPAVELALALGGDVHARNGDGDTAIHGAAKGFDRVIALLVSKGARVDARNKRGETALSIASARADAAATVVLLRKLGATE
jgi:ankyrin repeat protein